MNGRAQPTESRPTDRGPAGPPRRHADNREDACRGGPPACICRPRARPRPRGGDADRRRRSVGVLAADGRLRLTPRADHRDGAADRPTARAAGAHRARSDRVRLRLLDRGEVEHAGTKPEWPEVQRWPSGFRFPGGESFLEMQARMASTIRRLVAAPSGHTVVAVSHADPIKAAVASAAGTPLDLFQRLTVAPARCRRWPTAPRRALCPHRQLHRARSPSWQSS